jgi:hypothetical protein
MPAPLTFRRLTNTRLARPASVTPCRHSAPATRRRNSARDAARIDCRAQWRLLGPRAKALIESLSIVGRAKRGSRSNAIRKDPIGRRRRQPRRQINPRQGTNEKAYAWPSPFHNLAFACRIARRPTVVAADAARAKGDVHRLSRLGHCCDKMMAASAKTSTPARDG